MQLSCKSSITAIFRAWILAVLAAAIAPGFAGGYLAVDNTGNPYKWAGTVPYYLDAGPLGKLSKAQADILTQAAMSEWTAPNVPGSSLQFSKVADLAVDNGIDTATYPDFDLLTTTTDGKTSILYDQFGYMVEQLGAGQSDSIVGFAGPVIPDDYSPAPIAEGIAVFNGKFIDGDLDVALPNDIPMDQYRGVMIHELGHMLNLDHAQASIAFTETGFDVGSIGGYYEPRFPPDYSGVPTMFPFTLPEMETLEADDKAWITDLYPTTQAQTDGSISGTIRNFDNTPVDGMNVVAYSADDPTHLITCVSGYADANPTSAPTGTYKIPSLDPGSKWIVDVEPVVSIFTGGSSVGPIDPPAQMPGPPEYLNEVGFESATDPGSVTTTFEIPTSPTDRDITDVNLVFGDINNPAEVDNVAEIDTGTDLETGQIVPISPGKYTFINGTTDPNEPGIVDLSLYGIYGDFYRVKSPAGLELNQIFIASQGSILDVILFEKRLDNQEYMITSTASGFGFNAVSLYLDSSRMSEGAANGTYYFGVGFTDPILGGSNPKTISDYTLGLLFAVSDRDPLVVSGTSTGNVDPDSGSFQILGRGFKNQGGPPTVAFTTPGIQVDNVTYVNENTLNVAVTKTAGYTPGQSVLTVTNQPQSGGYGGRKKVTTTGIASTVTGWELY